MDVKKTGIAILARLSFVAIPLLALYWLSSFFYNPHQYCDGDIHRHTGGPVGYFILGFLILIVWGIALVIDAIWRFVKKENVIAFADLSLLGLAGLSLLWLG